MKNNILCFGEVLWDAFGDEKVAGGAVMNVAYHLNQQGANASFASRVGMDASGYELIDFLKENNLYSNLIQQDEKLPTCEVTVQLDKNQQATYVIPEPVSWDNIHTETFLTQNAVKTLAIVFGSLACREQATRDTLLNLLDETSALKVFDVNLRAPHYTITTIETLAAHADVVKMNEDEANLLINTTQGDLKDRITEFRKKYHAQTICVTRGENGAIVWHDYEFYEHPGCRADVVDTVGAGDSFLATFINGLLNKEPIQQVLERSCAVGAYVTGKRGANPVYDDGIRELLK